MKKYTVTFKGKDSIQYMSFVAKDAEDARRLAERLQFRRHERFPLTFARINEAAETGKMGLLAADPKTGKMPAADVKRWAERETERRKRDEARYDSGELKVIKVEEMK